MLCSWVPRLRVYSDKYFVFPHSRLDLISLVRRICTTEIKLFNNFSILTPTLIEMAEDMVIINKKETVTEGCKCDKKEMK